MTASSDDEAVTDLALAAARGNSRALEAFIKATQQDVWRFVPYLSDAGTADDLVAHLKSFEERYPGMQHINLSPPLTTPKDKIVEQYRMVGELVMPHFRPRPAVPAAAQ